MPTPKLARKCAATSRDFLRDRLQSAFTLANQLHWIAQYLCVQVPRCVCVCVCVHVSTYNRQESHNQIPFLL